MEAGIFSFPRLTVSAQLLRLGRPSIICTDGRISASSSIRDLSMFSRRPLSRRKIDVPAPRTCRKRTMDMKKRASLTRIHFCIFHRSQLVAYPVNRADYGGVAGAVQLLAQPVYVPAHRVVLGQ